MIRSEIYNKVDRIFTKDEKRLIKQLYEQNIIFEYDEDNKNEIVFAFPKDRGFQPTDEQCFFFRHLLDKINLR